MTSDASAQLKMHLNLSPDLLCQQHKVFRNGNKKGIERNKNKRSAKKIGRGNGGKKESYKDLKENI